MEQVIIRTFDNYFLANIQLTRLRDAGVQCYLKDEYTITIDPFLSNALGGIKLVVRKEDAAEAFQLLHSFDHGFKNAVQCPKCRSYDINLESRDKVDNILTAISTWLFSGYAAPTEDLVYRCNQCGFESEHLPESPAEILN